MSLESMVTYLVTDALAYFSIYLVLTLSLNMQQGYTGIANLGLFLPMAVGAYVAAIVPSRLAMMIYGIVSLDFITENGTVVGKLNLYLARDAVMSILLLLLTLILAFGVGSLVGYLSSCLAIKLDETYLAVFLLCLAEGARIVGQNYAPIAGGVFGISIVNLYGWMGNYSDWGSYLTLIGIAAMTFFVINRICRSPYGRLMKSIRENEVSAQCLGRNTRKIKIKTMTFASGIVAIAGVMHALALTAVAAEAYNRVDFSFWPWLMMIIGGSGNNIGVLLGTLIVVMLRRVIIISKPLFTFLPFDVIWFEPILLGIGYMTVMLVKPKGILPEKPVTPDKEETEST